MIEPAIVLVRLVQYWGAAVLMGSSLFFVYAVPGPLPARVRGAIAGAAASLAVASLLAIALQGSLFAGSLADGFSPESISLIVSSMSLGKAALARAALATLAVAALLALRPERPALLTAGTLGTGAAANLAWLGHGAASESWIPLAADIVHAAAAALWIGALFGFLPLLAARDPAELERLKTALDRFSTIGLPLVALLSLSGLANLFSIVGLAHLGELPFTPYGRLLLTKLAGFAAMLLLAALNRWRFAPALARGGARHLRISVGLEALLGFAVLALVAWLGTLEPFA